MSVSKRPIAWHQDCLENMIYTLTGKQEMLRVYEDEVLRLSQRVDFYASQIQEATKRGMDEFDRDKLLVKRVAQ